MFCSSVTWASDLGPQSLCGTVCFGEEYVVGRGVCTLSTRPPRRGVFCASYQFIHSTLDQQLDEDYEFSTDLMAAARYMPLFRRAARALVRYREALNAARQRVLQVRAGAGGPWCRYGMGGSQLRTFH